MNEQDHKFAIMFADVAGSSRLYEMTGDAQAQEYIARCLSRMTEVAEQCEGIVIKTIGDEIMCRFPSANDAVQAACRTQEVFKGFKTDRGVRISVRIGLHYGPAILDKGDLFGDAVNVAARMVGIAKSNQIITTEQTVNCLSAEKKLMTRRFDQVTVKGKQEKITIYEVLWEWEELTIMGSVDLPHHAPTSYLALKYMDIEKHIAADSPVFVIGRSRQCDIVITSKIASRLHARIEYRREKFVLIDQSTNGTYVQTQDGKNIYLRREALPLWGKGIISLGEPIEKQSEHLIQFICP